jgi:DASS family divalent anion:Na+ symporter
LSADATNNFGETLAKVKLFAGLERVDLARLAGYVESQPVKDGITVCHEGDKLDGVYVIARGAFAVFASTPDGLGEVRRESLAPGDFFGDMALIDDAAVAPTVRAESDGEILRLDRARVIEFLHLQPTTLRAITAILHRGQVQNNLPSAAPARQRGRTAERGATQERMARALMMVELGRLAPERLNRVLQASVLEEVSLPALRLLFDEAADEVARDLSELGIRRDRNSRSALQALRERFEKEHGKEAAAKFLRAAINGLTGAQRWDEALAILNRIGDRINLVKSLGQALRAVPPLPSERVQHWIDLLSDDETLADGQVLLMRAAKLESQGEREAAARLLRRGLGSGLAGADPIIGQQMASELSRLATEVAKPQAGSKRRSKSRGTIIAVGIAVLLAITAALLEPANTQGRFLLLLPAGLILWIGGVMPEFAVGFILIASFVLFGVVKPARAMAGFASSNWVFVLSILGLASAISRSGLLFRVGLLLVRRMPSGLFWQAVTLLTTGVMLSPLLPQPQGRAALTSPIALTLAEALQLRDRDPKSSVLGLAAWIGSMPLQLVFMNGAPSCLVAWGLLPEESRHRFNWIQWLVVTVPLGGIFIVGALISLFLVVRPGTSTTPSRSRVNLQLAVLGSLSRQEKVMIVILLLTLLGWIAAPSLGVDLAIVAVLGLVMAVLTSVFDRRAFQELDWNYLIFYGILLGLSGSVRSLGLEQLAVTALGPTINRLNGEPLLILLFIACSSFILGLALNTSAVVIVLGLPLVSVAPTLGVHPFIVLITILAASGMWFLPTQSSAYLVAYTATEGRLYSHAQARRVCFAYALVVLMGLALIVPYWRWLGLL